MASKREPGEKLAAGLIRIERGFLHTIGDALDGLRVDLTHEQRVHQARRTLKRLRAMLRLLAEATGSKEFAGRSKILRDVGRGLSAGRDAAVCLARLDEIGAETGTFLGEAAFRIALRRELETSRSDGVAGVSERFRQYSSIEAVDAIGGVQPQDLSGGIEALASKERLWATRAALLGNPGVFHEWRKRVKDLWAAGAIVNRLSDPSCKGPQKALKRLADLLGDLNDFVLLEERLRAGDVPESAAVLSGIRTRAGRLKRAALRAGRRLGAR
jgi:CHAD domain-containing protein